MKVLVYGTLRRGMGNHRVMVRSNGRYLGTETLTGYRMYSLHGAFPGIIRTDNPEDTVVAERYWVENLEMLDRLEGYDAENPERGLYNREKVGDAWVYTYNGVPFGSVINDWAMRA